MLQYFFKKMSDEMKMDTSQMHDGLWTNIMDMYRIRCLGFDGWPTAKVILRWILVQSLFLKTADAQAQILDPELQC